MTDDEAAGRASVRPRTVPSHLVCPEMTPPDPANDALGRTMLSVPWWISKLWWSPILVALGEEEIRARLAVEEAEECGAPPTELLRLHERAWKLTEAWKARIWHEARLHRARLPDPRRGP